MRDTTLGQLLKQCSGSIKTGPFGTTLKAAEYSRTGVPVISVGEVGYGRLRVGPGTPRVERSVTDRLQEYVLRAGDVVFGRKGAVDRSAWVQSVEDGYFLGSDGIRVRFGDEVDSRFMSYQFRSATVRNWLTQHAAGSTMPSLNQGILERVPVTVPGLRQQRAIAEVLGALDDKIAANTNSVTIVEDLLTASYAATVQDSPSEVTVAEIAHFHNRKRVPLSSRERESRPGSVPYYGATGVFGFVDEALFDEPLVLVGEDGSVVTAAGHPVVQYIWGPAWVNNHAHVLTGMGISTELLKVALSRTNVAPIVTGAVQPKISMGNLKRLPVLVPRPELRAGLEEKATHLTALVRSRTDEQKKLAATRDALLPALMSGKIRVKDAERVVEEVV